MVPHVTLYLDATPETCLKNINSRSRGCESGIPLEYLQGLDDLYRDLVFELKQKGSQVVNIDWNEFRPVDYILERLEEQLPGITKPHNQGYIDQIAIQ
jgi:NADH dehydrogenase (ubiquinone) 1 alpha subcomplex subunit 10